MGGKDISFSNPTKRDSLLSQKTKSLEKSFAKLFPQIHFKTDFKWAGTFASTKDGLPYIGKHSLYDNVVIAGGHAMLGISEGTGTGQLVTELIQGKTTSINISAFKVERFS